MNETSIEVQPAEMLTVIHNLLRKRFFEKTKHRSKKLFQSIESGKDIPFLTIGNEETGDVKCRLILDHSQYVGKLNFGAFRDALASHLDRTASKLKKNEPLNIFTADAGCDMIFHIPGFVQVGDNLNILVTGVKQMEPGLLAIRLLFLDPTQFSLESE